MARNTPLETEVQMPTTRSMVRGFSVLVLVLVALAATAGCGGSAPRPSLPFAGGGLGVVAGSRLFFRAEGDGARDLTVAVSEVAPRFSFELACGHVARPAPLGLATTASVSRQTLEDGRELYSVESCDRVTERSGDALPLFLLSQRVARALGHRERTLVRREHQSHELALMPVGRETLRVQVDGREVEIETIHASGGGLELWVATGQTPLVVRMRDQDHVLSLAEIDTGSAPRAALDSGRRAH